VYSLELYCFVDLSYNTAKIILTEQATSDPSSGKKGQGLGVKPASYDVKPISEISYPKATSPVDPVSDFRMNYSANSNQGSRAGGAKQYGYNYNISDNSSYATKQSLPVNDYRGGYSNNMRSPVSDNLYDSSDNSYYRQNRDDYMADSGYASANGGRNPPRLDYQESEIYNEPAFKSRYATQGVDAYAEPRVKQQFFKKAYLNPQTSEDYRKRSEASQYAGSRAEGARDFSEYYSPLARNNSGASSAADQRRPGYGEYAQTRRNYPR
jgi:hypothetical protein